MNCSLDLKENNLMLKGGDNGTLVAIRDIKEGDELLWDYGTSYRRTLTRELAVLQAAQAMQAGDEGSGQAGEASGVRLPGGGRAPEQGSENESESNDSFEVNACDNDNNGGRDGEGGGGNGDEDGGGVCRECAEEEGDGRGRGGEDGETTGTGEVVMVACEECGAQWGFVREVAVVTTGAIVAGWYCCRRGGGLKARTGRGGNAMTTRNAGRPAK